jgi:hypothetical protein
MSRKSLKSPLSSRRSSVHPVDEELEAALNALEAGHSEEVITPVVARAEFSPAAAHAAAPQSASRETSLSNGAGIPIALFTEAEQEKLRKYDEGGDGFLDKEDILKAFDALAGLR